jgi:hypothetical protein
MGKEEEEEEMKQEIYSIMHTKIFIDIQRGPVHFMPNDLIFACIRNRIAKHSSHCMKCFRVLYLRSNHFSPHPPTKKEYHIGPFLFIIFSIPNSIHFLGHLIFHKSYITIFCSYTLKLISVQRV